MGVHILVLYFRFVEFPVNSVRFFFIGAWLFAFCVFCVVFSDSTVAYSNFGKHSVAELMRM